MPRTDSYPDSIARLDVWGLVTRVFEGDPEAQDLLGPIMILASQDSAHRRKPCPRCRRLKVQR